MSYIELNKSAFFNNLDIITKKCKERDKIALVLKDNAYGHGLLEVAMMAKEYGITKVVVRSVEEAELIKDFFEYILILRPTFPLRNEKNYVFTINSLEDLEKFSSEARLELKVDSGMHRNGISRDEIEQAQEIIKIKNLQVEAVFTHYRSADTMSAEWFWQVSNFKNIIKTFSSELRFHSCNSAALFRSNNFNEDMVRVGISAYGCLQMDRGFKETGLQPVLSLYAQRISSRDLEKGERLGYNATFEAKERMQVSNYDIGYADGLKRSLSNAYQTPDGYELLGRVSMDNSSYNTNEETILIFDDANEMAAFADTIAYEILTSLSPFLKRTIIG